ncbi:hypothetical protein M758_UG199700 [Ceratodon purpureus]|nr:hypothetical protein M758_UG199700 [Ceratodon purpureus]
MLTRSAWLGFAVAGALAPIAESFSISSASLSSELCKPIRNVNVRTRTIFESWNIKAHQ